MAKQPSLAAQSGTLATAETSAALPAIFSAPQDDIKARSWPPMITFAHPKRTDEFKKIVSSIGRAPDDHDMFLIEDDKVTSLPVMKCGWMVGKQLWILTDDSGQNLLDVSYEEKPKPWKEQIEAVVLVYLPDRIVPANVQFRTTKCPGAKVLFDAYKACQQPDWADKSPAHRETLKIQQPFWRFYGNYVVGPPRPPKGGGQNYRPSSCEVHPVGTGEAALIAQFNQDPQAAEKAFQRAAERYMYRLNEAKTVYEKKHGKQS